MCLTGVLITRRYDANNNIDERVASCRCPCNNNVPSIIVSYITIIFDVVLSFVKSQLRYTYGQLFSTFDQWLKHESLCWILVSVARQEANRPENRSIRPWIIAICHRPLYCSNTDPVHCKNNENVVSGLAVTVAAPTTYLRCIVKNKLTLTLIKRRRSLPKPSAVCIRYYETWSCTFLILWYYLCKTRQVGLNTIIKIYLYIIVLL